MSGSQPSFRERFRLTLRRQIDPTKCRILVVDDVELNRRLIRDLLAAGGFENVAVAANGKEALAAIQAETPDLLILDLMMPVMDGLELTRLLRADRAYDMLPILVQTALREPEAKRDAFLAGANDIVTKPLDRDELNARARVHLQNAKLLRELDAFQRRLQSELAEAESLQESVLPSADTIATVSARAGVVISHHFQPTGELSGDYWAIDTLNDNTIGFLIADEVGHGVAAALRSFSLHATATPLSIRWGGGSPSEFLHRLNGHILATTAEVGRFTAALVGRLDVGAGRFSSAGAGMRDGLILRADGSSAPIPGNGLPLGISACAAWADFETEIGAGDTILCFSDALIETVDDNGGELPRERVIAWANAAVKDDPATIAGVVADRFRAQWGHRIIDDLLIVAIHMPGP